MDVALELAGPGDSLPTATPDPGLQESHLWTSAWASVLMGCCDSLCSAALALQANEENGGGKEGWG